jgi:hypothetical protein
MDQTCPVVHKSRRPQARLKTVTLFYIHCGFTNRYQVQTGRRGAWEGTKIGRNGIKLHLYEK